MRTPLLCVLALLCGAEVADAQALPSYAGYGSSYQPTTAMAGAPTFGGANPAGPSAAPGQYYYYYVAAPSGRAAVGPAPSAPPQAYAVPSAPVVSPGTPVPLETVKAAPSTPASTTGPVVVQAPVPVEVADKALASEADLQADAAEQPRNCCFWIGLGYTGAYISKDHLTTPLVTTGPLTGHTGALGEPGTIVLFGDKIDYNLMSGIQADVGGFIDADHHWSVEWEGQFLFPKDVKFFVASNPAGVPPLTRPIFDITAPGERSFATSFPGVSSGAISVDARSEYFTNEFDLRYHFNLCDHICADALAGFRFMRLAESLTIQDVLNPLAAGALTFEGAPINPGATLGDMDSFRTQNHFYGAEIGGRLSWDHGGFFANAFAQVGLGGTEEQLQINGLTTLTAPGFPSAAAVGGILALPSNIGNYERTVFAIIPEMGLNVGFKILPNVCLMVGGSSLLWNAVVRPGEQIDRVVNPNLVPSATTFGTPGGPARPMFQFRDQSFWVNSFNAGLGFQF